jgi:hypothetical protein
MNANGFNAIMIYSPETKRRINLNISNITSNYIVTKSFLEDAHSVHAGSSSSRLTCPPFFFLLQFASFLVGS